MNSFHGKNIFQIHSFCKYSKAFDILFFIHPEIYEYQSSVRYFFFVIAIATATSPKKVIATATATTSQKSNRYYYRYFGEVTSLLFRYNFATFEL